LQTRPKKSAAILKSGQMKVLRLSYIKRMHAKVKELVDVPVSLAMRYGNPSLCQGYKNYMIKVLLK
jgi:ferrochelatase